MKKIEFMRKLIEFLSKSEQEAMYRGGMEVDVDIPFITSVIEQNISESICAELLDGLMCGEFSDFNIPPAHTDLCYTFSIKCDSCIYKFSVSGILDLSGYCMCEENDGGYNREKKCCGVVCDWYKPKFTLNKIINMCDETWKGTQRSYWEYEREFKGN